MAGSEIILNMIVAKNTVCVFFPGGCREHVKNKTSSDSIPMLTQFCESSFGSFVAHIGFNDPVL